MSGTTTYTFTYPIDATPGDTVQSAFINDAGEVVGTYIDSAYATHGFVDVSGVITTFDDGANATTDITAVNNGGTFVGYGVSADGTAVDWFAVNAAGVVTRFTDPAGVQVTPVAINAGGTVAGNYNAAAFIGTVTLGTTTVFSAAGAETTTISAINAGGTIVGDYNDATGVQHGFIDVGGVINTVDPAGSTQTTINAINTAGTVAGTYQDASGNVSGFTDTAGVISAFAVPGNLELVVTGINDAGAVVGYYLGNDLYEHGFVLSNGAVSTVTVSGSDNTEIFGINLGGALVGVADDSAGLEHAFVATPACYCAGTRIAVPGGAAAIETLAIGDMVLTASGEARAIKWIGRRSYSGRFLAANGGVRPVHFRPGSLGDGLPERDLFVSPEHAMFLDDLLIPARCLVNGVTILNVSALERVDYLHLELDSHDVILAEGAASETFLDDESRGVFHNAGEFRALYPEARATGEFYAARVESGFALEATRQRLLQIANGLGLAA